MTPKNKKDLVTLFLLEHYSSPVKDKGIMFVCKSRYNKNEKIFPLTDDLRPGSPDVIWILRGLTIFIRLFDEKNVYNRHQKHFDEKIKNTLKKSSLTYNIPIYQFQYFIKKTLNEIKPE